MGNVKDGSGNLQPLLPRSDLQPIEKPHGVGAVLVLVQLGPFLLPHWKAKAGRLRARGTSACPGHKHGWKSSKGFSVMENRAAPGNTVPLGVNAQARMLGPEGSSPAFHQMTR